MQLQPGDWPSVVQQIGLGGALLLIAALSLGTAIAFRLPGILRECNTILTTILKHRREGRRIEDKVKSKQQNLKEKIEKTKAGRIGKTGKKGMTP